MDEAMKKWIDDADFRTLLERWRNSPVGDPIFIGEIGDYYSRAMAKKRAEVGQGAAVAASKSVGWEG